MTRYLLSAVLAVFSLAGPVAHSQNFIDEKPSPQQVEWQDLEFGVIIHFGTNTFLDREWDDGHPDNVGDDLRPGPSGDVH